MQPCSKKTAMQVSPLVLRQEKNDSLVRIATTAQVPISECLGGVSRAFGETCFVSKQCALYSYGLYSYGLRRDLFREQAVRPSPRQAR